MISNLMDYEECLISVDAITSRCPVENEVIYKNEISGLICDDDRILDILYCEIRDLTVDTDVFMSRVAITLGFYLVFVYEHLESQTRKGIFDIYVENVKKTVHLEKNRFSCSFGYKPDTLCRCLIRDIRYVTDIDTDMRKPSIRVYCDMECFILEEKIIRLIDDK